MCESVWRPEDSSENHSSGDRVSQWPWDLPVCNTPKWDYKRTPGHSAFSQGFWESNSGLGREASALLTAKPFYQSLTFFSFKHFYFVFVSENVCLWVLVPNVWRLENNLRQLIFSVYSVGPRTWILLINLVPKHWPGLVFKTHREDLLEESYYWTCGDNGLCPVSLGYLAV